MPAESRRLFLAGDFHRLKVCRESDFPESNTDTFDDPSSARSPGRRKHRPNFISPRPDGFDMDFQSTRHILVNFLTFPRMARLTEQYARSPRRSLYRPENGHSECPAGYGAISRLRFTERRNRALRI